VTHGDAKCMVTFPAIGQNHPLTGTELYSWWKRYVCVINMPKVVTWQNSQELNLRPSNHESNGLTITLPSHRKKVNSG